MYTCRVHTEHNMPRRKGGRKKSTRSQTGMGIGGDILKGLKKANDWARKTKVISKVANTLAGVGVPYSGKVASISSQLGYGKNYPYGYGMGPGSVGPMTSRGQF